MHPLIIKQTLCAAGYDDPVILRTVERIMGGKLAKPDVSTNTNDDGSESVTVRTQNENEYVHLVVTTGKTGNKTLTAGTQP